MSTSVRHVAMRLSKRALINLWRAPLPSLVSVLTIGLALFLGASFTFGLMAARSLVQSWGAQATLTIYLAPTATAERARQLGGRITREHPEIEVRFVGKAEALSRLKVDLGEQGAVLE